MNKKTKELLRELNNNKFHVELYSEILSDIFSHLLINSLFYKKSEIIVEVTQTLNIIMDLNKLINYKYNKTQEMMFFDLVAKYDRFPLLTKNNYDNLRTTIMENSFKKFLFLELYKLEDNIFLSQKQKEAYETILNKSSLVFSAPTSYGKTRIILEALTDLIENKEINNVLMIVPTKSLINEYNQYFRSKIKDREKIAIHDNPYFDIDINKQNIFIYTQERTLIKLEKDERFKNIIDYIVIDEAQSISTMVNKRNMLLLKALSQFPSVKRVFLIPFVEKFRQNVLDKLNISNDSKQIVVRNYDSLVTNKKQLLYLTDKNDVIIKDINDDTNKRYEKVFNDMVNYSYADACVEVYNINQIKKNVGTSLIFIASRDDTIKSADIISNLIPKQKTNQSKRTKALINHLKNNIHDQFDLIDYINKGVVYHNAYLDEFTKSQIERIINESSDINYIISTTTITKGINLTINNMYVMIKKSFKTSNPELEFKNAMGRSARLHKNNYGNLYYVVMNTSATKYLKLFKKDSLVELEIDIDMEKKKKLTESKISNIKDSYLLNDIDFKNSNLYVNLENYLLTNKLLNEDDFSSEIISSMDFLLGIKTISVIEKKIENTGQEKIEEYINSWGDYQKMRSMIKFISKTYDWDTSIKGKHKYRMKDIEFITTILFKVANGETIRTIINDRIRNINQDNKKLYVNTVSRSLSFNNYNGEMFNANRKDHINVLILNTLTEVQEIIEFEVKRFVQDFYYRSMKIFNINVNEDTENFLEYSTIDKIKVKLMQAGLTDSFAINELTKEPYRQYVENKDIVLTDLLKMIEVNHGNESPIYYAVKDRI